MKFLIILLPYLSKNDFVEDRVICKSELWTLLFLIFYYSWDVYSLITYVYFKATDTAMETKRYQNGRSIN